MAIRDRRSRRRFGGSATAFDSSIPTTGTSRYQLPIATAAAGPYYVDLALVNDGVALAPAVAPAVALALVNDGAAQAPAVAPAVALALTDDGAAQAPAVAPAVALALTDDGAAQALSVDYPVSVVLAAPPEGSAATLALTPALVLGMVSEASPEPLTRLAWFTNLVTTDDIVLGSKARKLDDAGDLEIPIAWVYGNEAIAQRVRVRLQLVAGEWFADARIGLPYLRDILGQKKPNLEAIRAIYLRAITETPGVLGVDTLDVSLDRATRRLTVEFDATALDGTLLPYHSEIFAYG